MKHVNATISCYEKIERNAFGEIIYSKRPFDTTPVVNYNGQQYTGKFAIVVRLHINGISGEALELINNKGELNCKLQITKCTENAKDRMCTNIAKFTVDIKEVTICELDYSYVNFVYCIDAVNIKLPYGTGKYAIQLLLNNPVKNNNWCVQTIYNLNIVDSNK